MTVAVRLPTSSATSDYAHYFSSMRPSDRRKLHEVQKSDPTEFLRALSQFLEMWAKSDWFEDYTVRRVASWIRNNGSSELRQSAEGIVWDRLRSMSIANDAHITECVGPPLSEVDASLQALPINTRTYKVFYACLRP